MGKTIFKSKLTAYNYFDLRINRKYATGSYELQNLRKWLNRKSISADYLYNNQSEYLVSVRAYPFWMENFFDGVGEYKEFPIGVFSASEVNTKGKLLSDQKPPVLLTTFTIPTKWGNYMDYAPYTKATLFIPYISFVSLDVNMIVGKTCKLYGQVDFDNGLLNVWLECNGTVIDSWETVIGIDININRTNGSDWARNMYLFGISAVTKTGGLMANAQIKGVDFGKSIQTGGELGTSFIGANQHHVFKGDIGKGVNKLFSPTSAYLIIEREQPMFQNLKIKYGEEDFITEQQRYANLYGKPLMRPYTLSSLKGFTRVGNIHLDGFKDALESERAEIENLLHSGVIL